MFYLLGLLVQPLLDYIACCIVMLGCNPFSLRKGGEFGPKGVLLVENSAETLQLELPLKPGPFVLHPP